MQNWGIGCCIFGAILNCCNNFDFRKIGIFFILTLVFTKIGCPGLKAKGKEVFWILKGLEKYFIIRNSYWVFLRITYLKTGHSKGLPKIIRPITIFFNFIIF